MIKSLIIILCTLLIPTIAMSSENQLICKENKEIIGPCKTIRGRLSIYNGNPSTRIWIVGTKRLLGIREINETEITESLETPIVPINILKNIAFGVQIFADFEVCPFTESKPGIMQMVCVESASNIRIVNLLE